MLLKSRSLNLTARYNGNDSAAVGDSLEFQMCGALFFVFVVV